MRERVRALARSIWFWPLLAGGVSCALYAATLAPGALGGDAGEMQLVPAVLGLAHPTGYPLQTLLGKLWTMLLPWGSVAWRMNLFSAAAGGAAVALLGAAITRLSGSRAGGLAGAVALAVSPIFWGQAVLADKYVLNVALLGLVIATAARWAQQPTAANLRMSAFAYGLSLTHHRSMLLFAPFLGLTWLWVHRRSGWHWREWAGLAFGFGLPLLLYAWLPIGEARGQLPGLWHPQSLADWIVYLQDRSFVDAVQPWTDAWPKLQYYAQTWLAQFGWPGAALMIIGIAAQVRRRERLALVLLGGGVAQILLSAGYEVARHWLFFLPSFALGAVWIGEGVAVIARLAGGRSRAAAAAALALSAAISGPAFASTWPALREAHIDGGAMHPWRLDLKSGYQAERLARLGLARLEPGATVLADWEQATPLWYFQTVEGLRPDVRVLYPLELLSPALVQAGAAYIPRLYPTLGAPYRFSSVGPMVRVSITPTFTTPPGITPARIAWRDGGEPVLALEGYEWLDTRFDMGLVLPLALQFRSLRAPPVDYQISVRLFGADGAQVWQQDRARFALDMYPTRRWEAGEVVGDYFEIETPRSLAPGAYRVGILLYRRNADGTFANLTVNEGSDVIAYLPSIGLPDRP